MCTLISVVKCIYSDQLFELKQLVTQRQIVNVDDECTRAKDTKFLITHIQRISTHDIIVNVIQV